MARKNDKNQPQPQPIEPEVMEVDDGDVNVNENLPAQTGPSDMETADDYDSGMDIDREDIIIPRMSIVQPTSDEGTQGTFRLNLTGDEYETLTCVFLKQSKGRVLFSKNREDGVVCGSSDRIKPSDYFIDKDTAMALSCDECQMKDWDKDKKTPPQCKETYNLLGLDTETGIPFWLQLKSTALRPAKLFLSSVAFRIQKARAKLCDYQVTLTLKEEKGAQGKYYKPVFNKLTYLKDRPYRGEAEMYAKENVAFDEKKPEEGEGRDGMPF